MCRRGGAPDSLRPQASTPPNMHLHRGGGAARRGRGRRLARGEGKTAAAHGSSNWRAQHRHLLGIVVHRAETERVALRSHGDQAGVDARGAMRAGGRGGSKAAAERKVPQRSRRAEQWCMHVSMCVCIRRRRGCRKRDNIPVCARAPDTLGHVVSLEEVQGTIVQVKGAAAACAVADCTNRHHIMLALASITVDAFESISRDGFPSDILM